MEIIASSKDPELTPLVSVIIVSRIFPNENLDEMLDSTRKFSFKYEIIIVLSEIQTGTNVKGYLLDRIKSLPNLVKGKIVLTNYDKGVSFGRNLGTALAESANLLFADDDIVVTEDVVPLLQFLESNECQGVQPLTLRFSNPEIIDSAGDFVKKDKRGLLYFPYSRGMGRPINEVREDLYVEEIPSMRSAFMIVRKEAFWAVGGFDSTFEFGYEDVDLGWRMIVAGNKLLFVPTVIVFHKGGRSTDSKRGDEKAEIMHLVNYYIMQLKITNHLWPYILLEFSIKMLNYELWKMRKRKTGFVGAIMGILTINKLFFERVKFMPMNKRMLAKISLLRGGQKLREFAGGRRFIHIEHD